MFKHQIGCCCRQCNTGVLGPFCLYQGPENVEEIRQLEQIDFRVHKDKPLCAFDSEFVVDSNGCQTDEVYYSDKHTPVYFGGSMDFYLDDINFYDRSWFLWGGYDKNGDYEQGPIEWSEHNMSSHYRIMNIFSDNDHTDVPFNRYYFKDYIFSKSRTLLNYLMMGGLALYPAYIIIFRFNAGIGWNNQYLVSERIARVDLLVINSQSGTFPLSHLFGRIGSNNTNRLQNYCVIYTITATVNERGHIDFHFPDFQLNICNCNTADGSREGEVIIPLTAIDSNSYDRIKTIRGNPGIFARVILHNSIIHRVNNGEASVTLYYKPYTYVFNPDGSLREYDNDLRQDLADNIGPAGLYEVWLCKEHQHGYQSRPVYDNNGRIVDHDIFWGSYDSHSQLRTDPPCDAPTGVEIYTPPLLETMTEGQANAASVRTTTSPDSAVNPICIHATRTDRPWLGCTHCTITECRSPTLPPYSDAVSTHLRLPADGGDYMEVRSRYCSPEYCSLFE